MNKIAIVDPASYTLPYDYYFIKEVAKYYHVDFYCSKTSYNYNYILDLRLIDNVTVFEYNISRSKSSLFFSIFNYIKLLFLLVCRSGRYKSIHFIWSILLIMELPVFLFLRNKFIFTFHNHIPHEYPRKKYLPYLFISKLSKCNIFVSRYTRNEFLKIYGDIDNSLILQHGIMPVSSGEKDVFCFKDSFQLDGREIVFWGRVEPYKGLDFFINLNQKYSLRIFGKWSHELYDLKNKLMFCDNVEIVDRYLDAEELLGLMSLNSVYVLPYKAGTQSGVLYTLLYYCKIFVCSSQSGETASFLIENNLSELVFDRNNMDSFDCSVNFAYSNYGLLMNRFREIRMRCQWDNLLSKLDFKIIYE